MSPARPPKSKHGHPAPPVLGQNAKSLDDLLQAIKDEYVYNTRDADGKNLLRTARKAAMRTAKRQLEACGTSSAVRVNKTSEPNAEPSIRFAIEVYDTNGTVVNRSTLTAGATMLTRVDGVPRYKDFNTIRKNHHVKDEEVLRYVPYFGETDDVDLSETYKVEVRSVGEEEDLELCKILSRIVERFLEIHNVTVDQVMRVLNEPPSKARPDLLTAKVERLKEQWDSKTEICLEAVLESLVNKTKTPLENQTSPVRGVNKNIQEDPLETYRLLTCYICTTHDCCFHELDRVQQIPYAPDDSTPYLENEACSEDCFLRPPEKGRAVNDSGVWTEVELSLLEACVRIQGPSHRVCCLAALGLGKPCNQVYATLVSKKMLPEAPPTSTAPATTAATVPSTTTTQPISEPERPPSSSRQSSTDTEAKTLQTTQAQQGTTAAGTTSHVQHAHKKRKTAFSTKSSKSQSKTDYPSDCNLSADNEKRGRFLPCDHAGPCGPSCSCVDEQVHCEKACGCPLDCPRRWRGCSCKRGSSCGTWSCECFKWSRECDVDLCGSCHAAEVLDPVNLAKEKIGEVFEGGCNNVPIQRGQTKRTMMGRSAIAGWGLFAGEKVKAGQFLGEYKGEIIGNEESERRGLLYDKKGVSFLFTLNRDQVCDATRAANKFRFVNHSRRDPNCYAKISVVNGVHRIGMYAKTDLYPGQELFFDYGYNSKSTKFVSLEHQARTKDTKVRVKLAGRAVSGKVNGKGGGGAKQVRTVQRVKKIRDESGSEMDLDRDSESYEDYVEDSE